MSLAPFLVLLLLIAPLKFSPIVPLYTYLPSIDVAPRILQPGQYEYDDGQKRVYFNVLSPEWVGDYAEFSIAPPYDDVYCKGTGSRHIEGRARIGSYGFSMDDGWFSDHANLSCRVISNNKAHCEFTDESVQTEMSSNACGHGEVIVTRIE